MEKAIQQEVELTRDPVLNYVPVERLVTAKQLRDNRLQTSRAAGAVTGINWVERGPQNVGGRSRVAWFDLGDGGNGYKKVWAAGVGGGLWYTSDITAATPTWNKIDDFFDNIAVTCFVQNPSNTQEMYFGTGEGWFNGDAIEGLGVWKSADGGANWSRLTSTASFAYVQDLLIDGNGNLYASVRQRTASHAAGVQKSTDGGATWTQVLGTPVFGSSSRGADLELAANGDIYASLGTAGSNGGIYQSTVAANGANVGNAGTWVNITPNSAGVIMNPNNFWYRIELACAPSDANTVYALFEGYNNDNCTSIQQYNAATNSWTVRTVPTIIDQGSNSNFTRSQAWYDLIAAVDPNDAGTLYIGGVDALRSSDSANSWTQMTTWSLFMAPQFNANQNIHADHHMITYAPGSSSRALWATDGGIFYTANADITGVNNKPDYANKNNGYNVTQYYACAVHPVTTDYFLAGAQDNGSQKFTAAGMNSTTTVTGGDGAFCHIDQNEPDIQITSYVYNNYYVSVNGGTSFSSYSKNNNGSFINPTDYDDNANILYAGNSTGTYFRWTDPATNGASTSVTVTEFGTARVTHVAVSQLTSNRVFFGLNNGSVVMVDNANTGTSLSGTVLKTGTGSVSCIAIDPASEDHMLVTYSNYGVNSVYESTNATQGSPTWTSVEGNLPDMPVRWAMFDPRNPDWALLATELGVWSTDNLDGGTTDWTATNSGLANVRVDMLQYRPDDGTVAAATHGRGLFTAIIPATTTPDVRFASAIAAATELTTTTTATCRGYTDYSVNMLIANPPTGDATITVNVSAGSAVQGVDFDFTTNGDFVSPSNTFIFTSGLTDPHTVDIRIYNDAEIESTETFTLSYSISGATDAQAGVSNQTHVFTISDNDAAPFAGGSSDRTIGTASYAGGYIQPFRGNYQKAKSQYIYLASELTDAGFSAGDITALGFNVLTKTSTNPYSSLNIAIKTTTNSSFAGTSFENGATNVYTNASYSTTSGMNTFTFSSPFAWDGTSNILVEICYNGTTAPGGAGDYVATSSTIDAKGLWNRATNGSGCNLNGQYNSVTGPIYLRPDITFTGNVVGTDVAVTLNTTRDEYLSGSSDQYYYSSAGEIMARIRNLTTHNYGCTEVQIDRAGTGSTQFWNTNTPNYLMDKTFRIIPASNDAAGQYEVTLYFTQEEVEGWQTATGQLWSNIQMIKLPGAISSVSPANPEPDGPGTVQVVTPTLGTLGTNYTMTYTFTNGFSGFGAGIPGTFAALPVTLLGFTGKLENGQVMLNWSTAFELNNRGFEVQKSYDGVNFRKIGFVNSAGNSASVQAYSLLDKEGAVELNYYRLKMIDLDNSSKLSDVILVRNTGAGQHMHVMNNPFSSYIDIRFDKLPKGRVSVQLVDMNGKRVYNRVLNDPASSVIHLSTSQLSLSSGVYILHVEAEDKRYTEKLVKK